MYIMRRVCVCVYREGEELEATTYRERGGKSNDG